jgi:hypothetical protein
MTGYTVHTGTSKKFVSGWDRVFGKGKGDSGRGGKSGKSGGSGKVRGKAGTAEKG